MHADRFHGILNSQIERTIKMLGNKADEYADDRDRLHNFRVISALQGIPLHQAVVNLMAKHTVSIFDLSQSIKPVSEEMWNEKITDHINYLILLQAALAEERDDETNIEEGSTFPNEDLIGAVTTDIRR
jgi:hypothetical protein